MDRETLAHNIGEKEQILCVVNTRQTAQEVFEMLPAEGSYHLSTRMTPEHRSRVLNEIRIRLREGLTCRVVSTSLIEAGVDVDFPEVWREMAGLDSILQAAGRCNREGRRHASESEVVIFSLPNGVPKGMQPNAVAAEIAMEGAEHIDESPVIRRYFEQLYWQQGDRALDAKDMMKLCARPNMKSIAKDFHLIDTDTMTIYIPTKANAEDIQSLKLGALSRGLMRRLGRSAVSVCRWDWQKLLDAGTIERITENTAILADMKAYDPCCGLMTNAEPGQGLWI
jgi:CRISPR-associated endonuclease/helicase Cas3